MELPQRTFHLQFHLLGKNVYAIFEDIFCFHTFNSFKSLANTFKQTKTSGQQLYRTDVKRKLETEKDQLRLTAISLSNCTKPMQLSCIIEGQTRELLEVPGNKKAVESMSPSEECS